MPIKFGSTEQKVIVATVLVATVSLGIGIKYFWLAFPEAAIEFRVNRDDSAPLALKFLAERGVSVEGYRHAVIFSYDDDAKVYLERTQGLIRMNGLTLDFSGGAWEPTARNLARGPGTATVALRLSRSWVLGRQARVEPAQRDDDGRREHLQRKVGLPLRFAF